MRLLQELQKAIERDFCYDFYYCLVWVWDFFVGEGMLFPFWKGSLLSCKYFALVSTCHSRCYLGFFWGVGGWVSKVVSNYWLETLSTK